MGVVRIGGKLSNNPLIVDGLRAWVCYDELQMQGWDFGIPGPTPLLLSCMPPNPNRPYLDFVDSPPRIENTVTGKEVLRLPWRYGKGHPAITGEFQQPESHMKEGMVQCDGQYLIACYNPREVLILDFKYMIHQ